MGPVDKGVLIFGIVAVAVGMILFFESRKPVTHTGPALTVIPSAEGDLSTITNATHALQAFNELRNPATPPVGVSAPSTGA